MTSYGKELILDLHDCDARKFNREDVGRFFDQICTLIGAEQGDRCWWDDVGVPEEEKQVDPRLVGTSAVQFILTSNITIHTLDLMERVYLNVFSCADFSAEAVTMFTLDWFGGAVAKRHVVERD